MMVVIIRILYCLFVGISGAPSIRGTNQSPNPPIRMGITIKIITKACQKINKNKTILFF